MRISTSNLKDQFKKITFIKNSVYAFQTKFRKNKGDNSYKYSKYSWDIPTDTRISKLVTSSKSEKQIVYVYSTPDPLTFRYRGYNMAQTLDKLESYQGHYFFEDEILELTKHAGKIDTLIFIRVGWTPEAEDLVKLLHRNGKKVGYDFDDWVFDIDAVPLLVKQIAAPRDAYGFYFYYVGQLYNLAKFADYFTATNSYLGDEIEKFFKKKCYVIPNYLNDEQIAYVANINKEIARFHYAGSGPQDFVIGYFSGTKTHDRDFELVSEQLLMIMKEFPQTKLMIVGKLSLPEKFNDYHKRVMQHGLKNYLELEQYMAACDLNLAPLVINQFTNCKSEIKYIDTALVYTPTVASPTYAFKNAIDSKENGLLAKDDQWYDQIKLAITDLKLYRHMQEKAHAHVLETYYGERINDIVAATMERIFGRPI